MNRSIKSNPHLDYRLLAYTPGETWNLLKHFKIKAWHKKIRNFKLPSHVKKVVFVSCAKTKPWDKMSVARSRLYTVYHQLIDQLGENVYFVTISEPLGIVPMELWGEFPQYDNPGLFRDNAQRSGLFKSDWKKIFGRTYYLPLDESSYKKSIKKLGAVVSNFIQNNRGKERQFISFVDNHDGRRSTHGEMLDEALAHLKALEVRRFAKRPKAREVSCRYMFDRI